MDGKKNNSLRFRLAITSLLISLSPVVAFAESKASSEITETPIPYEKGIKYLDRFTSKVWFDKGFWGFGDKTAYLINSFVQGLFWLSKTIFFVCAKIYEKLTDTSQFDEYITLALDSGASVFKGLTSADNGLLYFIGSLMFFYVAYVYFVQNGSFVRTLLKVVLIYACSSMLFYQHDGKYVLQRVYNAMNTVTSDVAEKSITGLTFTDSDEKKTTQGFSATKETNAVLDKYFDIAVWQPYQYMNGKVTEIKGNTVEFDLTEEQFLTLLDYDSGNDGFKVGDETMDKFVGKGEEVHHTMLSAAWGEKFTHVLASLVDSLVLGVILDVFAVMSFAMKIILVLLMLLSGFVALISMIPTFDNVLFNFLKRLGGTVAVSGLLSLCSLVLLWIYDILSLLLTGLFIGNPLLIALSKILVMWYLWKKRDFIVSILTANRVSNLSNNFTRRLSHRATYWRRRTSRNALKRLQVAGRAGYARAGLGLAMGAGALKLGARRLARNSHILNNPRGDRSGLYLNSLRDVGRRFSSMKHGFKGGTQRLQAEGLKGGSKNPNYAKLRETSDTNIQMAIDKKNQALGYKVRKHNQATKERLQAQRKQRENALPKPVGSFREYVKKERAYQSDYANAQKEKIQSQILHNQLTKSRLQKNRRLRQSKPLQRQGFKNYRIKENQTLSRIRKRKMN
ncbi:hypothetical protein [Streptococcus cuniculi]|uniref:Uncharacterized protein n=1 Tax=Streptococcus cuniculi TaxID=1432788 RepID=A0A4Y9JC77_9STRE|nr:hypothetical protein [Streptococcus cuniculi]MBF0777883.1 hypothetical protein [Streptococcus cuniculi]TFU98181.1 hypothetical protein E4T82_03990 [Streptococcus cuniculi]